MHVLPRVRELEKRHPDSLVVVGVHSGKFVEERKTASIRKACARLGVAHPVVNDLHFRQWRSYGVQAWPTIAIVDPAGYVVTVNSGEFDVERVDAVLRAIIDKHEAERSLTRSVMDFGADPQVPPEPSGPLRFPGRVIDAGGKLYVADSGNHRVLEVGLLDERHGRIERAFGSGTDGFADGPAAEAMFAEPQGLAQADGHLYVADRRNHAVRRVDLSSGEVSTVAGTGRMGSGAITPGAGTSTELRSPWGLSVCDSSLFISMAGSHQIWRLDLEALTLELHCGSGAEAINDGPHERAGLAQPTGLACGSDSALHFADCETSAIRTSALARKGWVRTIVGTGLFDFGDRDGTGDEVRLEHVQDVALHGDLLLAADTYNGKIRAINPTERSCRTLPGAAGSGEALDEPSGIWAGEARILVADTNNHRVVALDPDTGDLTELSISGET